MRDHRGDESLFDNSFKIRLLRPLDQMLCQFLGFYELLQLLED